MNTFSLCFSVIYLLLTVQNYKINGFNQFVNSTEMCDSNLTNVIDRFKALWPVQEWKEHGYFTDEYILNINRHWLQFGPPEKWHFWILGTVYFIMMVSGAIGNLLVIFMFIKCKSLRTPANTLILNLAVSDGLLIITETPIFIYNSYYRGPVLGEEACRLYGFMGGLTGTVSIITLSAISFDRYFVIEYPLHQTYSRLRLKICLVVIWLYGIVFSVIPALDIGLGKYSYEGFLTSCSYDYLTTDEREKGFIIVFCIAAWVVPFVLIVFSYSNIIKVVVARSAVKGGRDSFRHVKAESNKKQELKLAILVFFTICLWFLSWTPYTIISLLGLYNKQLITPLSSMIPAVFCKMASCINPFVYALSHPKLKAELRKICCMSMRYGRENHKIWGTQRLSKFEGYSEPSDVEEVEIDVKSVTAQWQTSGSEGGTGRDMKCAEKKLKRKSSMMTMLCLRPSFSNRSSTFSKVTRKLSARERYKE